MEYSKEDLMEAKKQILGVGENMGTEESKTHESQPLNQSDMNLKSVVVRIVKESCNQAHCRNH